MYRNSSFEMTHNIYIFYVLKQQVFIFSLVLSVKRERSGIFLLQGLSLSSSKMADSRSKN